MHELITECTLKDTKLDGIHLIGASTDEHGEKTVRSFKLEFVDDWDDIKELIRNKKSDWRKLGYTDLQDYLDKNRVN